MIKVAHTKHGLIAGDFTTIDDYTWSVRNPVMLISNDNGVMLMPLLNIVEENDIKLKNEDLMFGGPFTPVRDLLNHYNKIFGSGITVEKDMSNVVSLKK